MGARRRREFETAVLWAAVSSRSWGDMANNAATLSNHRGPGPGAVSRPTRDEFERSLAQLHGASFGWALACCRWNRAEAEDVLQTAYLRAIEDRYRFDGTVEIRTWFFGLVRNLAADRRRARGIRAGALVRWLRRTPLPDPVPTPEGSSDRAETCREVRRVLSGLSPRQREVLHLVFYQDMTVEQAAGVLGIPLGTARTHYERGKARMRSLLGGGAS